MFQALVTYTWVIKNWKMANTKKWIKIYHQNLVQIFLLEINLSYTGFILHNCVGFTGYISTELNLLVLNLLHLARAPYPCDVSIISQDRRLRFQCRPWIDGPRKGGSPNCTLPNLHVLFVFRLDTLKKLK